MTEEERFKKVYNIYMNYEAELATRGMADVPPIAVNLTIAYLLHEIKEFLIDNDSSTLTFITEDE
jgi:hypothetical protein